MDLFGRELFGVRERRDGFAEVAERLGHEDATLVLTTHGHLMPDWENRTRRAVDEAWRVPSVPQGDEEAL